MMKLLTKHVAINTRPAVGQFTSHFSLILLMGLLAGCERLDCCDMPPQTSVSLHLQNAAGENLLDSSTDNHIDESDISLFTVIDGKESPYYQGNLDFASGFYTYRDQSNTLLWVMLHMMNENRSSTRRIIRWGTNSGYAADTIDSQFSDGLQLQQIRLNGTLRWDVSSRLPAEITIIKEQH